MHTVWCEEVDLRIHLAEGVHLLNQVGPGLKKLLRPEEHLLIFFSRFETPVDTQDFIDLRRPFKVTRRKHN